MSKKMLIDAAHPEETRIAVLEGNRVEEFDFESHHRKQISANIYLAKITRVEPALQAAFVDFGGDRHGFLAFNEIHPDYYQIPFEDRQALLQETQEAEKADETDSDPDTSQASDEEDETSEEDAQELAKRARRYHNPALRKYKIQEVIKRRQIMLVQVVKEERGNKGAALTTYLSLAGRYCVLMPNTPRGVGVSRKITQASDRTRLKKLANNLEVSEGMGLIIRTAGSRRTQAEIRRDYEYLLRLWEKICEETLTSIAPVLIYEEGDLVKRAIRDLYDKHIEKVLVEGDEAYKNAKNFIRMLMPSHAKKIQPYRENTPLFLQYGIENDLDILHTPTVPLKSGGYLVINATEALIAIDVNSGRSTRERNIENTALKTNLEAVEETTRQMRLRDLAGLIVIDFIDMKDHKNNRMVEKKMREHLKKDRARVQMGRISSFGLMELSRQRRRRSVLEGSSEKCPSCQGYGRIRSIASSTLHALRALEEEGLRQKSSSVQLSVPKNVAFYLLNEKREALHHLQERLNLKAVIISDDNLTRPDFILTPLQKRKKQTKQDTGEEKTSNSDRTATEKKHAPSKRSRRRSSDKGSASRKETSTLEDISPETESSSSQASSDTEDNKTGKTSHRRRGRRGKPRRRLSTAETVSQEENPGQHSSASSPGDMRASGESRDRKSGRQKEEEQNTLSEKDSGSISQKNDTPPSASSDDTKISSEKGTRRRRRRPSHNKKTQQESDTPKPQEKQKKEGDETVHEDKVTSQNRENSSSGLVSVDPHAFQDISSKHEDPASAQDNNQSSETSPANEVKKPKRRGWWQRKKLFGS